MLKNRVYPSWRYHKELDPKIIYSEAEDDKHSKLGWVESPAFLVEKEDVAKIEMDTVVESAMKAGIPKKHTKGKSKEEIEQMVKDMK